LAALRRVSVVSSERTRGVKLQLEGQVLTLSSINPDVGEAADEVEIEYEGPPVAVGFNVKYVIDVLTILPSGSRVEIGLNDDVSPGLFSEPGDTDFRYVVMPMRL
jgi:DNA polymerase-3 subunit beta